MQGHTQTKLGRFYRNRLSDALDRGLFLIVFLLGASSIVLLKGLGLPQWMVTAGPVTVMALYATYVWASPRYRLREDRAGDNLYYLGFLYTLTSLAAALYEFTHHARGTEVIISNFGIALATTILGLALRVLFSQMREDPVEIEREARMELSEAVARLKSELNDAVLEFGSFRRATVQSLAEGLDELRSKLDTTLPDSLGRYAEVVTQATHATEGLQQRLEKLTVPPDLFEKTFSPAIETMVTGIKGSIEVAFAEWADLLTKMNATTRRTVAATERLQQRLDGVEVPPDLLEQKLAAAFEVLMTNVRVSIEAAVAEIVDRVKRLHQSTDDTVSATERFHQRLEQLQVPADLLEQKLTPVVDALLTRVQHISEQARTVMNDWEKSLEVLTRRAEEELAVLQTHRQAVEAELEMLRHRLDTTLTSQASASSEPRSSWGAKLFGRG